eukprot:scaffold7055_cov254-Pinguiococcus_pyrenoidosus.AAC.11
MRPRRFMWGAQASVKREADLLQRRHLTLNTPGLKSGGPRGIRVMWRISGVHSPCTSLAQRARCTGMKRKTSASGRLSCVVKKKRAGLHSNVRELWRLILQLAPPTGLRDPASACLDRLA